MQLTRRAAAAAALLLVLLIAAASPAAAAGEPDASEILRSAEDVRSPDLDYAVDFSIVVEDPNTFWKRRSTGYTMIARGKDHSLILVREPSQFYPGTLLIMNQLYWMLFPRSEKPVQLSSREILNGDVSNGDLARGNLLKAYSARLEGEERVDEDDCHVLELTRGSYVALHPRIRYWVDKKRHLPRKFEYYGETGRLLRTVLYEDYRKGPLGLRSMRIVVHPAARPTEVSTLAFTNLRRMDLSGLSFDLEGLRAFRDAARGKQEAGGSQVRPEDLLAELRSRAH